MRDQELFLTTSKFYLERVVLLKKWMTETLESNTVLNLKTGATLSSTKLQRNMLISITIHPVQLQNLKQLFPSQVQEFVFMV